MRRLRGDQLFPAVLLIFAALYLALDLTYKPNLRAAPGMVATIIILLLVIDVLSRLDTPLGRALRARLNPPAEHAFHPAARELEAMLWVASFAAALMVLGILFGVPVFVFAFMRLRGRRPIWAALAGSAAMMLFIWLLFAQLLRLELYPGLIVGGT